MKFKSLLEIFKVKIALYLFPFLILVSYASTSSSQGVSDLSIERIYLKGCIIHVNIVNKGSGGVSPKDYKGGKLLMTLQ